jgi:hypothetical protein
MSYANGKINLAQFEHAIMEIPSKDGSKIECVVIPIEKNNIFKSDKGNLFIDFGTKNKPENFKGEFTHFIKQSVNKTKYLEMKEKGIYPPDFGQMTIVAGGSGEAKPNVSSDLPEGDMAIPESGDLPF